MKKDKLEELFEEFKIDSIQSAFITGGRAVNTLSHPCNDKETAQPDTWVDTPSDCGKDPDIGDGECAVFIGNHNFY